MQLSNSFGMMLEMDVMSDKTFSEYTRLVFKDLDETTRKVLEDTRNRVKEAYRVINGKDQQQNVTDIAVSYDGSWHTRGHSF
ncbi:hypothetical protein JTE90_018882 [Oedothorax gibbosus]|uniref:Mutator-like transposase domain-containing protein n=1 Tax=Oedothorax gibbosus TaxID=931172 RepID=A0AAV6TPL8_9ARAC|nr:hypothetical protein JTE90_018882 [Oedothorax gibbosus]